MGKQHHDRRNVDLSKYQLESAKPRRAKSPISSYSGGSRMNGHITVNPRELSSRRGTSMRVGIAIIGAILLLPLFVGTPLVVAITLSRYFPIARF